MRTNLIVRWFVLVLFLDLNILNSRSFQRFDFLARTLFCFLSAISKLRHLMKLFSRRMSVIILIAFSVLAIHGCGEWVQQITGADKAGKDAMATTEKFLKNYNIKSVSNNTCDQQTVYTEKVKREKTVQRDDVLYKGPIDCLAGGGTARVMTTWLKNHGYVGDEGLDFFLKKRSKS